MYQDAGIWVVVHLETVVFLLWAS